MLNDNVCVRQNTFKSVWLEGFIEDEFGNAFVFLEWFTFDMKLEP